jgi:membrane-associated phospholipid phosphatase
MVSSGSSHCPLQFTRARRLKSLRLCQFLSQVNDPVELSIASCAIWLASRYCKRGEDREEADTMLASVLVAGILPDLKLLVRRRRPDRTIRGRRNGIPYSGDAWDSFPSGHAIHLGAMAPSAARLAPKSLRQFVWPTVFCLASTRTLILAHYPSDVAAGLAIGLATNKALRAALGRWRISRLHKKSINVINRMSALRDRMAGPRELTAGNAWAQIPGARKRKRHFNSLPCLLSMKAQEPFFFVSADILD